MTTNKKKGPNEFFISDHHFGHDNIIKHCNRPFKNGKEMDRIMISRWNSTVKPEDTVYYMGDFAFHANRETYEKQLNGRIIFIKGNHDNFQGAVDSAVIKKFGKNILLTHRPTHKKGYLNLYGHCHATLPFTADGINMSVEHWDYRPQTFQAIMKKWKEREQ